MDTRVLGRAGESVDFEKMPHVVVLDLNGLSESPMACIKTLHLKSPNAKCILLDEELPDYELASYLEFGMKGFVRHLDIENDLGRAIRFVNSGGLWIEPDLVTRFVRNASLSNKKRSYGSEMTLREREIRDLAMRRLTNKEIADMLGIQEATVKFHLSNVFSKLQINGRRQLNLPPA